MRDHARFGHDRLDHRTEHDGTGAQPTTVELLDGPNVGDPVPGFEIPPDNGLGVSAGFIVSAENAVIQWTDIAGAGRFEESLTDFWKPLGDFGFPIDVRAQFDPVSGRFVVSDAAQDVSGNSHFLIAVSNDADPNDGWNFQGFTPPDPTDSIDQPALATDGQNVYLVATLESGQEAFVVPDAISNTGAGMPTAVPLGGGGIYKEIAETGIGDLVFAQDGGVITIKHIDAATAAIDATSAIDLGPVSSVGEQEFNLPTLGTATPVDAEDQRIYGSAYSNGFLYVTFQVLPPTGPDAGVPTAHWAELDVRDPAHAALVSQGDISGSQIGAGIGTFDSSIAVDGNGDVLINFAASGASIVPTDYYVVRQADGTFSAPTEYKTSAGPFVDPNASPFGTSFPVSRWGDYSSAVADPQNPNGFWISGEYGTTPNSWQWGTAIAHVIVSPNAEGLVASKDAHAHTIALGRGLHAPEMSFISMLDRGAGASHDHTRDDQDARASPGADDAGFASAGLDLAGGHHQDLHGPTMHGRSPWSGTIYQPEQAVMLAKPDAIG